MTVPHFIDIIKLRCFAFVSGKSGAGDVQDAGAGKEIRCII